MGAVILGALALYLLISIAVVKWAIRYARKHGKSAKLWGFGAAFIMYNFVFWDWIPTVIAHKYYCSTEAGFWVYKTLDQWKKENPVPAETQNTNKRNSPNHTGDQYNFTIRQTLTQKIQLHTEQQRVFPFLSMYRLENEVIDENDEVLARQIDFSSGESYRSIKFWINEGSCSDGIDNRTKLFQFVNSVVNNEDGGK